MVVTDDQGRYVVPDLPKAKYKVWVRGYGLVDSAKVDGEPGKQLNLTAVPAPNEAEAAQYYPAIYWYSMLKIPDASQFGGKDGDIPDKVKQSDWLNLMKNNGCVGCHQLGQLSTRTIPPGLGEFASPRRGMGAPHPVRAVRRADGEHPGRPARRRADQVFRRLDRPHRQGRTAEDQADAAARRRAQRRRHHLGLGRREEVPARPDRVGPAQPDGQRLRPALRLSPNTRTDVLPILDPKTHTVTNFKAPVRDADTPEGLGPGHAAMAKPLRPSPYWGDEKIWDTKVNNHNAMFDEKGRVWLAAAVRGPKNPDFCKKGSDHPSAKLFPLEQTHRAAGDARSQDAEVHLRRHLLPDPSSAVRLRRQQHAVDQSSGGGGGVVGWVNTKMFDETGDAAKSQGWTALILDTNGNGKRDEYVEPNQPLDPTKDKRIAQVFYAVMPNPVDGSVWGTLRASPGSIVRLAPGSNPPETALAEIYNVPMPGFGPRGGDIDSKGVVWVSLASGHIGSFDRSKCKGPLNGPKATGDHCPEGWAFYQYPGPGFDGIGENSAESSYYTWVDQHDTFGLGKDVPMSTANLMDGLVALKDGKMVSLRVPYPMGFYAKGFDGRIDDPNAGWKGRGLWTSSGDRTPWLIEGGKGMKPMAVHFQLRPDPLAK